MDITVNDVILAYRKFKRFIYYDKTNLYLRFQLAEFESAKGFKRRLSEIADAVNGSGVPGSTALTDWLSEVSFRSVVKSLDVTEINNRCNDGNSGKFISNVTSASKINVEKVNYFFEGPIELHLIAVLWIMREGKFLDAKLGKECYGARIDLSLSNDDDKSCNMFMKYHELYSRWRDSGIRKAKQLLTKEKKSVCIIGLDVKEYYYHIDIDYGAIAKEISESNGRSDGLSFEFRKSNLLACLEAINRRYQEIISPFLQITHGHLLNINVGIPIGLCSSPLLANWYLKDFDEAIKVDVRPAYYGRYVDDILMVIATPEDFTKSKDPIENFMDKIFIRNKILHGLKEGQYEFVRPEGLYLQRGKCILQHFDARHSIAGLEKFQKKLEENSSSFLLMPIDEADTSLENVAYELLYDGSVNKFRSVQGMSENRYELAKYLARQTILHLLTDDPPNQKISVGLMKFFKGKNAIEFSDLWERVFTLFAITSSHKSLKALVKQLYSDVNKVRYEDNIEIEKMIKSNLVDHLRKAIVMAATLDDGVFKSVSEDISSSINSIRKSNLVRHHFIRIPLLNYTTYSGALSVRHVAELCEKDIQKIVLSPRYVHFDECMLLAGSGIVKLGDNNEFDWAVNIYSRINGKKFNGSSYEKCKLLMSRD